MGIWVLGRAKWVSMWRRGTKNSGAFPIAPGRQMKGFEFDHLWISFCFAFVPIISADCSECGWFNLICFSFSFFFVLGKKKDKVVSDLYSTLPLNAIPDFGTKPKRFVSRYLLISTTWVWLWKRYILLTTVTLNTNQTKLLG